MPLYKEKEERAKHVERDFCELRQNGVLRSSLPEIAPWHTKIVHLGDVPLVIGRVDCLRYM